MNIPLYAAITFLFILCFYFMFNGKPKGNDFGFFSLVFTWVLGGAIGFYLDSTATAIGMSVVMSFIFI